ncbi:hypothetical protein DAI22_05g016600 [Oryza sativa Japonica Group]|jgi:hypothetical protein|nr:hypothetical protein DAI22_05g016600 [Oryza sativa Japonica Group]
MVASFGVCVRLPLVACSGLKISFLTEGPRPRVGVAWKYEATWLPPSYVR